LAKKDQCDGIAYTKVKVLFGKDIIQEAQNQKKIPY